MPENIAPKSPLDKDIFRRYLSLMPRKKQKLGPGKFVRFPRPILSRIEAIAIAEDRTVSATVRVLVERALAAHESNQKQEVA